ncbi:TAXI family TRAP transporter solute-binding subunit [Geobacter sulfurreducens]|uniref:Periplasmic solute-binding protein n=2 Tax=Geobacter TaxID=28231 RepID=Q749Q0_GEOSL|nr:MULTISPECIES: TAXI family TRAP transporter solute-binding subunit [Geobacter]AAR36064.1 periplasmic solute-binding protein [Geobacter sulfurreducens PCA]ADI85451.1 periplasmic solute-binding protein [Geobacter sulfurreducens KN400]MBE2888057.1 TAXI family TRAP transporter solute-binding subunit [Geobacter anodireducens]QVW34519.1 TAXI family TRAP transporter solute-binding subunit [Geobacter sulfurreducens]UAC03387.1 TAXI family TRAP transporter solute-binding subunit [Geobacter sulfurreduc
MTCFSRFIPLKLSLLAAVTLLLTPAALPAFPQHTLSIGSGNTTGSYYVSSSAIAKIFNRRSAEYGMRLATVSSQGSVANVESVSEGRTAFGIAQDDVLRDASRGAGRWAGKSQPGLRAVLGLPVEAVTVVAAADAGISRMGDLKGKRVNIGAEGSFDHDYAVTLLRLSGLVPSDVVISTHPASLASELLQKNDIDAYIYTVSHPNLAVMEASTGPRKVVLVPLDTSLIERVTAENPLLLPAVVPTSSYPVLEHAGVVPTIGIRSILFTRSDMAEETVYRLVRDIMTNFDLFRRQHPSLQVLSPREAADAAVIPLHPGAERFFREAGTAP